MSDQQWSRAHDALLAERAEGWRIIQHGNEYYTEFQLGGGTWGIKPVDHYLTDLAAIARAQEAWRLKDADFRAYEIEAVGGGVRCECRDWNHGGNLHAARFTATEPTESAARAWATWRALGGGA